MVPQKPDIAALKDLTIENITGNVHVINSDCQDTLTRFLFERLVAHLDDFARETRLSTAEWETAIRFLTECGKICSDTRQKLILLSDVLDLSLLVDSIDHPKAPAFTEGTVLGPFHAHVSETVSSGAAIPHDPNGEPLLVPVVAVDIDVWETDSKGFYDVQYAGREGFDGRAVLSSDEHGDFHFKVIVPVPYPIPDDGLVGRLLAVLKRHQYRPSHMHFMALYLRRDPYETSDVVFGVKELLIVDLQAAADISVCCAKYGMPETMKVLKYDFFLVADAEITALRNQKALDAASCLGLKLKLDHGLLVRDD
ncbi:hypothetical protein COCVIDRAFT_43167 [Bipolaris victoriae FI3]|uniref:Intradiol ring-cleavage dioxygenases domain-containing protein n=1 Tax=Bipolaris victoriae (strain FI3) TaxID=930091 RepID=W7E9C4_BIPV3|nr:hypothetical protein COCVIDRAFT_43167 [Bipolaris victoriae FI3]